MNESDPMSSDLLHTLGAQARETRCEPWRGVVEGRVSADEAAGQDSAADEVIEASKVLFEPTPDAIRDQILSSVLGAAPPVATVADLGEARAKKRGWVFAASAAAAVAAAILLVVMLPDRGANTTPDASPVVALGIEYDLELSGGFAKVRGDEPKTDTPLELATDAEVRIVLRPEVAVPKGRKPGVVVFAARGTEAQTLTVDPERAPNGTMVIAGSVDEVLPLSAGEWTLTVVVGPEGHLPAAAAAVAEGAQLEPHWQVLRRTVTIVESR